MGVPETREQIRPQVSIHEKPPSIVTKGFTEIGKAIWSLVKIIPSALLTLVKRKSQYTLIYSLENKESEGVVPAFFEAMKPFKENIHKISLDSGKAFRDHESLRKKVNTPIYFTPTYPF